MSLRLLSAVVSFLPGLLLAQGRPEPAWLGPFPGIREVAADTGRMQPGWRDFSRYGWVGPIAMCAQAVDQATSRVWRHAEHDTASYALQLRDTTPPATWMVAQRCGVSALLDKGVDSVARGAPFPVFADLLMVAIALHRDDAVRALVTGYSAHLPDVQARSRLLYEDVNWRLMDAHPPRIALAEWTLGLLDTMAKDPEANADVYWARLTECVYLWQHWRRLGDTARMRTAIEATFARHKDEPPGWLSSGRDPGSGMYNDLLDLAILQHGVRSQEVVAMLHRIDREQQGANTTFNDVPKIRRYGQHFVYPETPYWYAPNGTPLPGTVEAPVATASTGKGAARDSALVTGARGPSGAAVRTDSAPVPSGKVTLVYNPDIGYGHVGRNGGGWDSPFGAGALNWVRLVRKLLDKYGPQGLQVVVVEQTQGFAPGSLVLEPEYEASAIRQFYQDQLGLKATIAVQVTAFRFSADGRRVWGNTPWERKYLFPGVAPSETEQGPGYVPSCPFLLDRHGRIRHMGGEGGGSVMITTETTEVPILEMFIQQLLQES